MSTDVSIVSFAQAPNVRDLGYYPVLQWTLRSAWLS